ncbi:MAG: RecX family transcriptional regulator [Treponema sp.]|jgi:regulatory protein|nr:RecX family transcriptional regulator [Treponema sp.]
MQVVSVKLSENLKAVGAVYRIELSDGSLFSIKSIYVPSDYYPEVLCVADKILSSQEEEALRFAASCLRVEQQALGLVARAEQSSRGLSRKLAQRGHTASCVHRVVSHLIEQDMVNDHRYAQLWLQARIARRLESPRYLITALRCRGIERDIAQEALNAVLDFDTELALLNRYLARNHLGIDGSGTTIRQKLKYEGFSPQVLEALEEG